MTLIGTEIDGTQWELEVLLDGTVKISRSLYCTSLRKVAVARWDGENLIVLKWIDRTLTALDVQCMASILRTCIQN